MATVRVPAPSVADVLRGVDATMYMRSAEWLQEALDAGRELTVLDLRATAAFSLGHIPGAVQVLLSELPDRIEALATPSRTVVCVCNGSVQSAMAVVFLRTLGFQQAFNLSGGMSAWERQGRPIES